MWGHLKIKVYVTPPTDIDDLTQRITENAQLMKRDPNLVWRAVRDMVTRAILCIERDGKHVEGKVV